MTDPRLIIQGLIERGVPRDAAIGFAGNMQVESGFDPGINEINPLVEGSRGGFGLSQWTGPRRRELEAYAQNQGVPVNDLDMQLDFLVHELGTTETRARDAIYGAGNPQDAARLVSERFLRPGIPHLDKRLAATNALAGGDYQQAAPQRQQNALSGQQQAPQMSPQQNALAQMQAAQAAIPQWRNSLDVRDFLL